MYSLFFKEKINSAAQRQYPLFILSVCAAAYSADCYDFLGYWNIKLEDSVASIVAYPCLDHRQHNRGICSQRDSGARNFFCNKLGTPKRTVSGGNMIFFLVIFLLL